MKKVVSDEQRLADLALNPTIDNWKSVIGNPPVPSSDTTQKSVFAKRSHLKLTPENWKHMCTQTTLLPVARIIRHSTMYGPLVTVPGSVGFAGDVPELMLLAEGVKTWFL